MSSSIASENTKDTKVLILIILEVLYEFVKNILRKKVKHVLILIILEVLYESYHYNHVIFNRKQQKA